MRKLLQEASEPVNFLSGERIDKLALAEELFSKSAEALRLLSEISTLSLKLNMWNHKLDDAIKVVSVIKTNALSKKRALKHQNKKQVGHR